MCNNMHSQKQKQDKQQSTIKGNNNNNNGNVIPWINETKTKHQI